MQVPLFDLKQQSLMLKSKILNALSEVIDETSFVKGPKMEAFEQAFASYHGASSCIGLNSGTDALYLLFKALGVKPGDEIITSPYTFFATGETIANSGATLKLVDIENERYTLDPKQLEAAITPKTVGIVPVHIFGMPADMTPILEIANKHHVWVVEDAAQAHGALYKGKKVGTLGNAGAFSFYPTKNLGAFGDAGAVITHDQKLSDTLKLLRDHGQKKKYHSDILGYNSRLDGMQAAILSVKLPYLDEWNRKRRQVASWYESKLKSVPQITLPKVFPDSEPVFHLYTVEVEQREQLASHLEAQGISTRSYYAVPLHLQPPFAHEKFGPLPISERVAQRGLSLPMFPELTEEQVSYVADHIRTFFS